jgi:ABC-type xylose transport system substrate-binding protein
MDAYMTFDFETIGKYQAEEAVKAYPKGNYVLCSCDDKMSSIAVPMHSGIMGVLQPYIDGGIFMLYWIMLFRMLIRVLPWQMWKTR